MSAEHPAAQDRGCLSEQAPDTVSGGGTPDTSSAASPSRDKVSSALRVDDAIAKWKPDLAVTAEDAVFE